MECEASSPLARIDAIREILTKDGSVDADKEARRKAAYLARKLMIGLEEPGDLIDRIIFQVYTAALVEYPRSSTNAMLSSQFGTDTGECNP